MIKLFTALALSLALFTACGSDTKGKSSPVAKVTARQKSPLEQRRKIESIRLEKDHTFQQDPNSPIPKDERNNFKNLSYFPVDVGYQYECELKLYEEPEKVTIGTNRGDLREYIRYGYFEFTVAGKECKLDVFKMPGTTHLFVPFRDVTSGKETYGAGRYIELEQNRTGIYTLDFNLAFNPYCAYNESYSCPLPPEQNTLKVEIRAGEKNYHN